VASAVTASSASAACVPVVFFEERIYVGDHAPKLDVGRAIGEGEQPDGCNDVVKVVDGVTVENPPVPLRDVIVRSVVGRAPAEAVAVDGDPDTVFLFARKAPVSDAAGTTRDDGFIHIAVRALALLLLGGGAFALWRLASKDPKRC
jgi:hypothetical protein